MLGEGDPGSGGRTREALSENKVCAPWCGRAPLLLWGASTGSPALLVHRHTSHHTHHPLSARLPPPHKLRRLPPTSARHTRRKRKKEKTSAPPSEGTPPIQEEGGAGADEEEEEEEEEEGDSETEPVELPPLGPPQKAKVWAFPLSGGRWLEVGVQRGCRRTVLGTER